MHEVGIIGYGIIGSALARHLGGRPEISLSVLDVDPIAIERAKKNGLFGYSSLRELAAKVDVVVIAVGFDSEVSSVVLGEGGLASSLRPGSLIIVVSTVSPQLVVDISHSAQQNGIGVVDAPVVRGQAAAEAGKLLTLLGGEEPWLSKARSLMSAFCTDLKVVGDVGDGQRVKALNNYLLWCSICMDEEVLRLANELGLDEGATRDALLLGSGSNVSLERWYEIGPLPWAEKDLEIVQAMAGSAATEMPLLPATQMAIRAIKARRGEQAPRPRS